SAASREMNSRTLTFENLRHPTNIHFRAGKVNDCCGGKRFYTGTGIHGRDAHATGTPVPMACGSGEFHDFAVFGDGRVPAAFAEGGGEGFRRADFAVGQECGSGWLAE